MILLYTIDDRLPSLEIIGKKKRERKTDYIKITGYSCFSLYRQEVAYRMSINVLYQRQLR